MIDLSTKLGFLRRRCFNSRTLAGAIGLFILLAVGVSAHAAEKEVSFKTEDGVTIYGMYAAADGAEPRAPAVLFLHSFDHDRNTYGQYLYPGLAQIIGGNHIATLRIDIR